ncbi:MAG: DUF3108 domain-containing protein [Bdellovibrionales bacterium]|nr:DUF3108 domain-containing protein [Bdellovibrionales bacterium]
MIKIYYLFIYLFLFSNTLTAKNKKNFYKEEYVYKVKYFNVNIGEIKLVITNKDTKKSNFVMKLDTKKKWSWIYSLHQLINAKFKNNFSQLIKWNNIKKEKYKSKYENIKLSFYRSKLKKIKLTFFNKKKKIINKRFFILSKNKIVHSPWTAPWYVATLNLKNKKSKIIHLLYKGKLVKAKINKLNKKTILVLKKKIKTQIFSVSSIKNKSISLKIWVSKYKKNNIVSNFNLKLKTGRLKASLKSYKKEPL